MSANLELRPTDEAIKLVGGLVSLGAFLPPKISLSRRLLQQFDEDLKCMIHYEHIYTVHGAEICPG